MQQYMNIGATYAKAFYESLSGDKRDIAQQLAAFAPVLSNSSGSAFFYDPAVSESEKITAVSSMINKASYDNALVAFFAVIIKNKRLKAIEATSAAFSSLVRKENNISYVIVEVAAPMDEATTESITTLLEQSVGGDIELEQRVQPDLIGGLRVYINSTLYDFSVDTRLKNLASLCKKHSHISTETA